MKPFSFAASCAAVSLFALGGCAVGGDRPAVKDLGLSYHSTIQQLPDGNYYVEVESALGAGGSGGADSKAYKDAQAYCQTGGMNPIVIKEERDSSFIVNGVDRLTFTCR